MGKISFPRDEGWHPEATNEWWYFNGHLVSEDGRKIGIVVCFFTNSILDIVVDEDESRILHKASSGGFPFKGSQEGLDIRYGSSWWRRNESGRYLMHYEAEGLLVELEMNSTKEPLLADSKGVIREGLLGSSFYYAQTSLRVSGRIRLGSVSRDAQGRGWIDRQWGSWEWSGLGGWRWFSIQLERDVEILGIQVTHPLNGAVVSQSFNVSKRSGDTESLKSVSVAPLGVWTSPDTRVEYEMGWSIQSPNLNLRLTPLFETQEINKGLWEGDCLVDGRFGGGVVAGRAYVELSNTRVHARTTARIAFLLIGLVDHLQARLFRRIGLVDLVLRRLYRR